MESTRTPDTRLQGYIPAGLRLELLALLAAEPQRTATMTYDEFLTWATEDTLAEWVDGKVIMTSPASARHQLLTAFIHDALSEYARTHDLGTVLLAPFQMKLPRSGREPDVLFVAAEHLSRLLPARVEGPADLVVEILSPESKGRDRGEKFYEYEEGGVPEYWLVDPATERAEFYQRDAQGAYQPVMPDADGVYHARALPGFRFPVAWLWRTPLPTINAALLAIDGEAYARRLIAELTDGGFLPQT